MLHRVSGQPESYKRKSLYRFGKAVGQGTHSIVREADCVLGKVAVKVILKRNIRDLEHKFFTEAEVLKRLNHPNIIRYIEHYESKDKLYLVTELARGGELFDRLCELGNFTETLASQAVSQILEAIHYMHQRNILYLDLKTENVMYETRDINSRLMLIDFGTAKMLDPSEQGLKKMVGSFGHAAPEVMLKEGCGKPADMWSLGVIAYELLCGYSPFRAENLPELIEECRVGKIIFHERYWHNISSDAKDFIRGLLQVDPAKRPSAEQARKHRWITDYSVGTKEEAPSVPGTRSVAAAAAREPEHECDTDENNTAGDPNSNSSFRAGAQPTATVAIRHRCRAIAAIVPTIRRIRRGRDIIPRKRKEKKRKEKKRKEKKRKEKKRARKEWPTSDNKHSA
ncbi:kinase-like domain-containing protein [Aspergillus heterothallicus]